MNEDKPSKSARKRENLALQDLGEALTRLGPSQLEELRLDEPLMRALIEARSIRSRGALRRQRQLIGKLMRQADAEAIRAALESFRARDGHATRLFHEAENWRDRICAEGAPAVAEFATGTGRSTDTLLRYVQELAHAPGEHRRRGIARQIFREVHARLAEEEPRNR